MHKIQIITMGASDDKLVSIRGTIGEAAMRFFADRLFSASADSFMVELHDTGEALRVFDGWGEMCMIEAKSDRPETMLEGLGQKTSRHYYTIGRDEFVEALNKAEIQLPRIDELLQRASEVVTIQHGYDPVAKMYYCSVADEEIGWWCGNGGTTTQITRDQALTFWNHLKNLYGEDAAMTHAAIDMDRPY